MPGWKFVASSIVVALYGSSTLAQQTAVLEEVVVTATKRAESLQDIPVTVNAFSAETIQAAGIQNTSDLAILTPALNINMNTSPFNARMTIRGVGTAQTDTALEPSVGLFVNGVFLGRTGLGMSDLTDIERIEVLQGPQGTLYGKNTNAGAISVITKKPNSGEFEGHVEASVGDYSLFRITASTSGPITDNLAYRLSGSVHQRDGYYDNSAGDDLNDADDWNLQGKLLWEPADSLSVLLSASHIDRDTTCCGADAEQSDALNRELVAQGFAADANDPYDFKVQSSAENSFELQSDMAALTINYAAEWGDLTSITAWNDYDYVVNQDPDRSQLEVLTLSNDQFSGDSFSQELRLDSTAGETLDYMVGLFYYEQTTKRGGDEPFVTIGADFLSLATESGFLPIPAFLIAAAGDNLVVNYQQDTKTIAAFGQVTWHIGERWHLTGGLRWTDEEKDSELFSQSNSSAPGFGGLVFLDSVSTPIDARLDRSADNVDWLLRGSMDIGDDSMLFASAASGTKSGGFQTVNGDADNREFEDEDTLTYELGIKSTLLDARLRINASAFYSEIDNFQAQRQLTSGVGTFVSNEATVEVSGLDLQVEALPLPNLTLTAGLLYMHKYDITDGPNEGDELPFTADVSGNLAATMVFPLADGGIYWRTDYSYMDDHSTNVAASDDLVESDFDDRNVVNTKVGWRNDQWNVSIWGRNLTDDEYASQTITPNPLWGTVAYFLAPPRTYGATLRYDF